jgi:hypothetical protein
VFPVRYELNFYIVFRRNSVFKGLKIPNGSPQSLQRNFTRVPSLGHGRFIPKSFPIHYSSITPSLGTRKTGSMRVECNINFLYALRSSDMRTPELRLLQYRLRRRLHLQDRRVGVAKN